MKFNIINRNIHNSSIVILSLIMLFLIGCKKDWLDEKPKLSFVVPTTIADYQALLDNSSNSTGTYFTGGFLGFNHEQNFLPLIATEEFNVLDASIETEGQTVQNTYKWAREIFTETNTSSDWNNPYKKIFYTNIVLEGIEKIIPVSGPEQTAWNQVKGSALFFRAFGHFEIAQEFSKPYDETTSNSDLGIPLRLSSDLTILNNRATVQETYSKIISDIQTARDILPVKSPNSLLYKLRPTKNAADALLARIYLSMGKYDSAWKYADHALSDYNELMNYNTDLENGRPVRFNKEVIFHSISLGSSLLSLTRVIVNPDLYSIYSGNDLRKAAYFRTFTARIRFVGGYDQSTFPFTGLATDEMLLIRAETNARKGMVTEALRDLNSLLEKRWTTGTFVPVDAANTTEAIQKILLERRKELCFRGIRWSDLRRLNKEPQFVQTLTRTVAGRTYTLPPNDLRYVFPIPPDVIQLSGMQQNPR